MIHEKILLLEGGREAKVVLDGQLAQNTEQLLTGMEILVKDPQDKTFRLPIGTSHPMYWKSKRYDSVKSRLLQWEYSGITKKQINYVIREFQKVLNNSVIGAKFRGKDVRVLKSLKIR
ncbi:hypothetical protein DYBT9275_05770 [Dyadobacter sp. CECT 9275]|uniref:Uncharacterized protein n=1 Tax=Dyadobacter helix TaxID=2822344 RepID=A0A916JJP1_9BACT|nr:hypothetical protein [Dyadobacter sp. CECT 9275]CAG5017431.1 hypothetical protein DYBT9275_05770 [Dyadobacter sp. CECT 9275]